MVYIERDLYHMILYNRSNNIMDNKIQLYVNYKTLLSRLNWLPINSGRVSWKFLPDVLSGQTFNYVPLKRFSPSYRFRIYLFNSDDLIV